MKKLALFALLTLMVVSILCPTQTVFAASTVWDDTVGIRYFSTAEQNTIVIKDDNSLWACGINRELLPDGDSALTNSEIRKMTKIMDGVISADASAWYLMIVRENGELLTKGTNVKGGMGIRDNTASGWLSYDSFMKIMDDVQEVKVGSCHTLALKNDNTLWAWGDSERGQVGDGTLQTMEINIGGNANTVTSAYITQPKKIMDNVKYFATATYGSCAITYDGSLWCWGYNGYGQIGDGSTQNRATPVKVLDSVQKVVMTGLRTMALKTDGSLWTWGNNDQGALLDETTADSLVPKKVLDKVKDFSCTNTAVCVITDDGSLYARGYWSSNFTTEYQTELKKILDSTVIVTSNGGARHIAIMSTDGSLYTIGQNLFGKIGDGSSDIDAIEPVKIHSAASSSSILKQPSNQIPVTQPTTPTLMLTLTANPTSSNVLVNGKNISFDAYNVKDNNYFKLRDIAYTLNGTDKQFDVSWDETSNSIILTSGKEYTPTGGEMTGKGSGNIIPTPTNSKIFLDGKEVAFTAYNIEENNYFKLRDIGLTLNFGVDWDGVNNTILVDTSKAYVPD